MILHITEEKEKAVCGVLKALVEEFGAEHIIVSLPTTWKNPEYSLGSVKLEFTTEDSIKVNAQYNEDFINYEVQLDKAS